MQTVKLLGLGVFIAVLATLGSTALISANTTPTPGAQDIRGLDSRVNQLEQRLYQMENRINRIEQMNMTERYAAGSTARDVEINRLRTDVDNLRLRLSEAECGVVKLDERTSKRPPRTSSEPCRQNPNASIQLPARP